MANKPYPLSNVHTLLESGPVVLLTTARGGRANIMALSWHTMMEFEPPLIGCIIGDHSYSFRTLRKTKECVIGIPHAGIAKQAVGCGKTSGAKTDKFKTFGLTPLPASRVGAPLIGECFANFECRVTDTRMVNKYGLFVLEVVSAWIDPSVKNPRTLHHCGGERFMIAGEIIRLKPKMK